MRKVIVCTPCSKWGEFLVERLLKRDLMPSKNKKHKEAVVYSVIECSRAELYNSTSPAKPYSIVCDFNNLSASLACRHLYYLRKRFPDSGLIIAHEDEKTEETADIVGACVVYSDLMRSFVYYPKGSRRFIEAAQIRMQGLKK